MMTSKEPHPAAPTVFVSSTVKEFRDIRSAIAYTLRERGLTVHLSEDFEFGVRGDRSAFEECFENIRSCDYYILLIGYNRGTLYNKDMGISITRQEYRVARDQFLSSGRPRLLLYLREDAEKALLGGETAQKKAGIDDAKHLADFIDEVQHPPTGDAPNFLTRFRDSEDVIRSLDKHLNLGRNLAETLTRNSLVSELAYNLTKMVQRYGSTAFPRHRHLQDPRQKISITPSDLHGRTDIPPEYVASLVFALVGRVRGDELSTKAMEESLNRGVFLQFNPASKTLQESNIHKALRQTIEDITTLRELDTSNARQEWDWKILGAIKASQTQHPGRAVQVEVINIALLFSHHNIAENVFNGHVALCKVLTGLSDETELASYPRHPATPFGEKEEHRIRAERVSTTEIVHLIQGDIWPFGNRATKELFGRTPEEQVQRIAKGMSAIMPDTLKKFGLDKRLDPEILKNIPKEVAKEFLDKHTASPEEGIEDLRAK